MCIKDSFVKRSLASQSLANIGPLGIEPGYYPPEGYALSIKLWTHVFTIMLFFFSFNIRLLLRLRSMSLG